MQYLDILFGFGILVAMFGGQIYLVKRLTAFVKDMLNLEGNWVRFAAFVVGVLLGGLFLWPWIEMNPGYSTSIYVLTSVMFLIVAGLTASGDYDLGYDEQKKHTKHLSESLNEWGAALDGSVRHAPQVREEIE